MYGVRVLSFVNMSCTPTFPPFPIERPVFTWGHCTVTKRNYTERLQRR